MKNIQYLILSVFVLNCNSVVELRNQKTSAAVRPEEVNPGCYRQVGTLQPVYKNVPTTEVEPGGSVTENIPAKKDSFTEKIMERPAYKSCSYNGDILFCKEIPPSYKDITVVIDYPAYNKTITTPEVRKTILRPTLVEPERPDIRNILCPDLATVPLIRKMQNSLKRAGFDPGADNGILYRSTMNAIREYEIKNGFKPEERSGDDFIMQNTVNTLSK